MKDIKSNTKHSNLFNFGNVIKDKIKILENGLFEGKKRY